MQKDSPYFSIILPTKDRPELLLRAIQSVLNQTYNDFELIVINDHSSYDINAQISKLDDPRIILIHQQKSERSAARNAGIGKAKGQYICFLDDDDLYLDSYLDDFYQYYENRGKRNYILRTGFNRIRNGRKIPAPNYQNNGTIHPVLFFTRNMGGIWTFCIPSSYLRDHHFPEEFPHWQDTHLILRLLAVYPFKQLDSHNYVYHQHQSMGSQMAMEEEVVDRRLELNIQAVEHLFREYGKIIGEYVPKGIEKEIIAGKYLHFASGVITKGNKEKAKEYLKKSVKTGIYPRFWRYYGYIIKELLFN
jgi:glycosyltransferase involved in cell wall biosynthesis